MAWISHHNTPDLLDAEFDSDMNVIKITHPPGYQNTNIWMKDTPKASVPNIIFLNRLRHAIDEAIKYNLEAPE